MGVAGDGAVIVDILDNGSGTTNERLTPNDVITISGLKLNILGNPALTGICFAASDDPSITIKASANYVVNNPRSSP
ncbi:MAG: DUF4469 domain-containing protein [Spirochaetaceae bacterium]|jgi:hypothetical protein|nr:DUF4469 domain-containing protein [Spirochaetaceae bacterium]